MKHVLVEYHSSAAIYSLLWYIFLDRRFWCHTGLVWNRDCVLVFAGLLSCIVRWLSKRTGWIRMLTIRMFSKSDTIWKASIGGGTGMTAVPHQHQHDEHPPTRRGGHTCRATARQLMFWCCLFANRCENFYIAI